MEVHRKAGLDIAGAWQSLMLIDFVIARPLDCSFILTLHVMRVNKFACFSLQFLGVLTTRPSWMLRTINNTFSKNMWGGVQTTKCDYRRSKKQHPLPSRYEECHPRTGGIDHDCELVDAHFDQLLEAISVSHAACACKAEKVPIKELATYLKERRRAHACYCAAEVTSGIQLKTCFAYGKAKTLSSVKLILECGNIRFIPHQCFD